MNIISSQFEKDYGFKNLYDYITKYVSTISLITVFLVTGCDNSNNSKVKTQAELLEKYPQIDCVAGYDIEFNDKRTIIMNSQRLGSIVLGHFNSSIFGKLIKRDGLDIEMDYTQKETGQVCFKDNKTGERTVLIVSKEGYVFVINDPNGLASKVIKILHKSQLSYD